MITVADVRLITSTLPRSYEVVVRDRIKFRIGQIVYLAFSRDETVMGFAFPKDEREGLIASEPDKFMLPRTSEMRYNWVHVRLDAIDLVELREIVLDAWRMCVPKSVAASMLGDDTGNGVDV
ncbi:MmcQ/YjbR family DNA-binding protein [Mycolicibacterium moriokaense]|nr:MmcQ/YjbR family DNA-binding protein [Mycolicibacterium moriokaense]